MEAVVEDEAVGDAQTVRFHRMSGTVVKVPDVRIVKVDNSGLAHVVAVLVSFESLFGTWQDSRMVGADLGEVK